MENLEQHTIRQKFEVVQINTQIQGSSGIIVGTWYVYILRKVFQLNGIKIDHSQARAKL